MMKSTRGAMLFPLCLCAVVWLMAQIGAANVALMGNNLTLSFDDVEATFAPGVEGSGVNGIVYTAEPLNACSALTNKAVKAPPSPFALIMRGGCTFVEKVKNAQDAGFKAAIVYDNENSGFIISMAGSSSGIHIYAVLISKVSGETLKKFSGRADVEVQEDNCTSSMCAICLEDYNVGEKIRVLPCHHKFHAACVDMWLTSWRSFCPVCKRDAGAGMSGPPASETTPLFSSAVHLPSPSSSFRSSVGASPPRPISRRPSSQSVSRIYSVSGTPHSPYTQRPYRNSSAMSISRSGADLANMSSPYLRTSLLCSTHSLIGNHLSPPVNISYAPPHMYSYGYASSNPHVSSSYISNSVYGSSGYYLGSSSQHWLHLRRCGESGPSLSTMAPQSPQQQSQLRHGGDSEKNLNLAGASSAQSFRQSYLIHGGDSDASLSAMASSGQSFRQSCLRYCGDSDASMYAMALSGQSLPGC